MRVNPEGLDLATIGTTRGAKIAFEPTGRVEGEKAKVLIDDWSGQMRSHLPLKSGEMRDSTLERSGQMRAGSSPGLKNLIQYLPSRQHAAVVLAYRCTRSTRAAEAFALTLFDFPSLFEPFGPADLLEDVPVLGR